MNDEERRERGMKNRRQVLGDEYVDRGAVGGHPIDERFPGSDHALRMGRDLDRPGLDRKTRSCITVAMTVALNKPDELALHLRGALRNGVTKTELREVLLQTVVYCGIRPRTPRSRLPKRCWARTLIELRHGPGASGIGGAPLRRPARYRHDGAIRIVP